MFTCLANEADSDKNMKELEILKRGCFTPGGTEDLSNQNSFKVDTKD